VEEELSVEDGRWKRSCGRVWKELKSLGRWKTSCGRFWKELKSLERERVTLFSMFFYYFFHFLILIINSYLSENNIDVEIDYKSLLQR